MFTRPSRAEQEREQARLHLARAQLLEATNAASHQLRDVIAPAVAVKARDAKDWAGPKAADARAWAGPKAQEAKAWAAPHVERGLEVAGPRVEAAVEKLTPAVDAARDKIVDELLPRVVEAVNAASVAAAGATTATTVAAGTARKRSKDAAAVLRGEAIAKPIKQPRSKRKLFLVLSVLVGVGSAVFAAFKRQSPQEDPWAVPPGSPASSTTEPGVAGDASASGDTLTSGDPLASGDASDALGGTGNSLADPDVPGLTTDSGATAGPVEASGTERTVDPLTSPIEDVEGGPNNT
ncbi:MAG TPA: hypothetical protein VKB14_12005, partial [Actinomycetales bacterium]|nr:hypothetical protein [Actinomycetales bacterium]